MSVWGHLSVLSRLLSVKYAECYMKADPYEIGKMVCKMADAEPIRRSYSYDDLLGLIRH
ncbi:MAG: hypothetical protein K6F28_00225 [Lachnospiraceae bacterium]|nr:hypothetical protein [Lachnospiraceae bacterium]